MNIGKRIQELRKKNNLTQEELAERVDVARQTISKWELEETSPDLNQINKIADAFNISIDEFINSNVKSGNKKDKNTFVKILSIILKVIIGILSYGLIISLSVFIIACLMVALLLIIKSNLNGIIPYIPYGCTILISVTLILLSVLTLLGNIYLIKFTKSVFKNLFVSNILNGIYFKNKKKYQNITFITLVLFIILLIISIVVSIISSGSLDFFHKWNWFN